ncbi:MAG TPA: carboxypeptidase regulatory-like domain-containing protein, partial [Saprospiraceae bacterium]|nr:carboxypeptidase regulatory-like domain-containing protein [Saprospiraceae bacterium]
MVRSLLLTFAMLLSAGVVLAQTILTGKVIDESTKEDLIGASVKITKGGEVVKGAATDFNGSYRIALDPGKYDVEVTYTGYTTSRVTGVQVLSNTINYQNFEMSSGTVLDVVEIKTYKVPLIKQDETSTGQAITSEQIKNLPTRSVQQIVATTAGTTSIDGGDVSIKGSRSNATNYYIDGIRVQGSPPPVQDLEQLQVITGGLGAEYGDVTGGVISLTTKGPASEYHGAVEVENSHGLDPYGWLLTTANVSGPILRKKMENGASRTVVGFRMSGQYLSQKDDDPPAIPVYIVKEDVRKRIEENPIILENGIPVNAGEQLTWNDVNVMKYRPFEKRQDVDVTGKLDFRLTEAMDFSVTGTFKDIKNQETPDPEGTGRPAARLLNAQNNPTEYD